MPQEKNAFKLGLTAILFLVLFVGMLLFIAGGLPSGAQEFTVRFRASEMTTRLKEGGEVICGGQPVGTIKAIRFENTPNEAGGQELFVCVVAAVGGEIGLRQDARIIPGEPLLGDVGKLVIRDRGVGDPVDPRKPIEGQRAGTFGAALDMVTRELDPGNKDGLLATLKGELRPDSPLSLLGKIHQSMSDLNQVTRSIRVQLDPDEENVLIDKITSVVDNINAATALLRQQVEPDRAGAALAKVHLALDSLNRALATTVAMMEENRPAIREAIGDVRDTARLLDEKIAARIAEELDAKAAASLLAKIHGGIARLDTSLRDLNDITGAGRSLFLQKQGEVGRMVTNFVETSEHLKATAKDLYRNPWRLLYQPTDKESRELNVFDAARSFAEAAARLDNASIRLQGMIEAGGGALRPDDPELLTIRQSLQETFEQFSAAEKALWKQLNLQ